MKHISFFEKQIAKCLLCLAALCLTPLFVHAQEKEMTLIFSTPTEVEGCKVYVKPLTTVSGSQAVQMTQTGNKLTATVPVSAEGLYNIIYVRNNGQYSSTVKADGEAAATLPMQFRGNIMVATDSEDNKALGAFTQCEGDAMRSLWTGTPDADRLKKLIIGMGEKADSVVKAYGCSDETALHIKMWAYTSAGNAYLSLPHVLNCKAKDLPFGIEEVMAQPQKMLDTQKARLFSTSTFIITSFIPSDRSLSGKLDWLYENFHCKEVTDAVADGMLDAFVSNYDYAGKYAEGLKQMKALTEKYHLDAKYLNKFIANKVTIQGNAFPEGLTFADKDGRTHTIDEFKGKYVYIDLWASWCVPCCKEVPYIQKLEKELANKDVVFLSISIDQKKEPWIKKMEALQMHGNQWHDPQGKLANALNVHGIPFFVIYDTEGKLYYYNAPRPSHPQLGELLEGLKASPSPSQGGGV